MANADGGHTPAGLRRLAWLVPGVALAVALFQTALVRTTDLSPWKGGGFGMFSTADAPDARVVRGFVVRDGREYPADLTGRWHGQRERIQRQPALVGHVGLEKELSAARWEIVPGNAPFARPAEPGNGGPVHGARVEVERVLYSAASGCLEPEVIASAAVGTEPLPWEPRVSEATPLPASPAPESPIERP